MSSNRLGVDDDNWWNESTTKGFDFGDESDSIGEEVTLIKIIWIVWGSFLSIILYGYFSLK